MDTTNNRSGEIHIEDERLREPVTYFEFNRSLGLPDQSLALDEAVRYFGQSLPKLMQRAFQGAPFLFKSNFFLNNITFFLRNIERCERIFQKFQRLGSQGFIDGVTDINVLFEFLSNGINGLQINKKIARDLPQLLGAMDALLDHLLRLSSAGIRLPIAQAYELLGILSFCRSQQEVDSIMREIKQGHSVDEAIQASEVKPAKYRIVGLKILDGCTVQCRYCCENTKAKRAEWNLMSVADLQKLDWLLDDIIQISVTGGEPFDSPHLFEIMDYLKKKGASVAFLSSGGELKDLRRMLPYFKDGTICRVDLSMHDSVSQRAMRKFHTTVAFLVQNNIPFVIIPKGKNVPDLNQKAGEIDSELESLGLWTTGEPVQDGKNRLLPYYAGGNLALHRDPLVRIENTLIMPSERLTDPATTGNLNRIIQAATQMGYRPSQLCRFGNLDFRSDGTVSACDAIVGPLRVKRLMDHFPESEAELDQAVEQYRARMQAIWDEADRRGCHTCCVHLEKDCT